jgi:hypothetical protein
MNMSWRYTNDSVIRSRKDGIFANVERGGGAPTSYAVIRGETDGPKKEGGRGRERRELRPALATITE